MGGISIAGDFETVYICGVILIHIIYLTMKSTDELIARAYDSYLDRVIAYVNSRINDLETSRDIAQEVFVRLLEYSQLIYESAIENFVYTITRNLVNDHLRRYYVRREYDRYVRDYIPTSEDVVERQVIAREIVSLEQSLVDEMPRQRAAVYRLKRYEELSAKEIAEQLGMSVRTVENHYYLGMKHIKEKLAACM